MIPIIQRSKSDTASIGEGSPCCAVVRRSFCKGLAGWVHFYDRGGNTRHHGRLAALGPHQDCAKNSPLSEDVLRKASRVVLYSD
jgi:hypothetical protein